MGRLQACLFFGLISYVNSKVLPKTDLTPFQIKESHQKMLLMECLRLECSVCCCLS